MRGTDRLLFVIWTYVIIPFALLLVVYGVVEGGTINGQQMIFIFLCCGLIYGLHKKQKWAWYLSWPGLLAIAAIPFKFGAVGGLVGGGYLILATNSWINIKAAFNSDNKAKNSNHYDILGVQADAPEEVIKAAYKALSQKHHPDRGGSSEQMSRINEAYAKITTKLEENTNQKQNSQTYYFSSVADFIKYNLTFFSISTALVIFITDKMNKNEVGAETIVYMLIFLFLFTIFFIRYKSSKWRYPIGVYGFIPTMLFLILAIWIGLENDSTVGRVIASFFLAIFGVFFIGTSMSNRFQLNAITTIKNPSVMQRIANPNILEIIAWFFIFTLGSSVGLS